MLEAWPAWLEEAIRRLEDLQILRSIRTVRVASSSCIDFGDEFKDWEQKSVEIRVSQRTLDNWINGKPSTGDEEQENVTRTLVQFSGNDYLGLSMHPAVRSAAAKAAIASGMGLRGSALICGYTTIHRQLETSLAQLKRTEECLLCPTGFAANMAVMTAISTNIPGFNTNKIGIFSDELNHASIIDGVRVGQKQSHSDVYVYKHNNLNHLEMLLSACKLDRKVVVTDSLFSMDGDLAHLDKLVQLRQKYSFLLIIDDAHGTLVCGENGGGVAEVYGVEDKIDIYIGTLSKAFGCHGGFIATSRKWKLLIQSRGRSFIYSTALPIPVVAAAHAALDVAINEKWRRETLWSRMKLFSQLTGLEVNSPIIPIIVGSANDALQASKNLLKAGFHVLPIRPPVVPANSSRLRVTLCASHTEAHIKALYEALLPWISRRKAGNTGVLVASKL